MGEMEGPNTGHRSNTAAARRLKPILLICVVSLALGFGYWWIFKRHWVATDNAYVRVDSARISARIPGTVIRVHIDNDHPVREGQLLYELDPADYRVAVDKARAALQQDEADVQAAGISISMVDEQTAALVQAAEAALKAARDSEREARHRLAELKNMRQAVAAELGQVERDFGRFDHLYQQGAGTARQQEQSKTALKKARAQLAATDAQTAAVESALAAASQQVDRAVAQLQAVQSDRYNVEIQRYRLESLKARRDKSRAELDAALLNLSYCRVEAPIEGYIAQKSIQMGDRIQPGQVLMAVVPLQDAYIEANFKETQLTGVRIGQPARVRADVYPGFTYKGRVAGIRAGTGAAFSLIPAENATGNWIKVVQRVPVKIEFVTPPPSDYPLRLGLSLEVTVDTSDRSGAVLVPADSMNSPPGTPSKP